MKIQTWTKLAAMLLLTGVLAGCEQSGVDDDNTVVPVTTPDADGTAVDIETDLPAGDATVSE